MSKYIPTTATKKILGLTQRIRVISGGTSASKTISVLLYLIHRAQTDDVPTLSSVVSESFPHLQRGAMRDFLDIMKEQDYFNEERWNQTMHIYTFEKGSAIEFFSADQPGKVRGPRRDRLFINEANNIPYETFDQLEIRTKEFVILDHNPTNEYWAYTEVLPVYNPDKTLLKGRTDVDFLILTYKDNEALAKSIVSSIEQHKGNKAWWQVYGLGLLGEVDGKIYKDWQIIEEIPHEAKLERHWLDFGYSNDPASIGDIYSYNGGFILDQQLYQKGLSNKQLADRILNLEKALTVADSSEPKSIDEIASYGVAIIPAIKGRDSVAYGIKVVQDQRVSITKRSIETIKEYRNYMCKTDKNGKIIAGVPEGGDDHCFAPETLIHTTEGEKRIDQLVGKEGFVYSLGGSVQRFYNVRPTRKNTDVLSLEFEDGNILTVTPDHQLLRSDGLWTSASLLSPMDRIESGIHEKRTNFQWKNLLFVPWCKIFQQGEYAVASGGLGIPQWQGAQGFSYSSQRFQSLQQLFGKFRISEEGRSFTDTQYTGVQGACEEVGLGRIAQILSRMGFFYGGQKADNGELSENLSNGVGKNKTTRTRVRTLSQKIYNACYSFKDKILWPKLQNESTSKAIKRITRGFCALTYDLEVENTHCLVANGVIAHNSMDGIRYAITSIPKLMLTLTPRQKEDREFMQAMKRKKDKQVGIVKKGLLFLK